MFSLHTGSLSNSFLIPLQSFSQISLDFSNNSRSFIEKDIFSFIEVSYVHSVLEEICTKVYFLACL